MPRKPSKLDRLQIPEPCSVGWENMTGDDRSRFCSACNKHVYDLSAGTRRRAEAIIATSRGNLCARIVRRADGSIATADDLVTPLPRLYQLHSRRASPLAGAVVSALLAFSPVAAAQTQSVQEQTVTRQAQDDKQKPQDTSAGTTAKLSGTVVDVTGAVIAGAKVSLMSEGAAEVLSIATTSEAGTFQFNLQEGIYAVKVESQGFSLYEVPGIKLEQSQQRSIEVKMEVGSAGSGIIVSYPKPLRALYRESDLIVIATVGNAKKVASEDERSLMKTALTVSSTLKGKAKATVYVYHWVYKDEFHEFAAGNKLLLFLQKREAEDGRQQGYEVDDVSYGVKQLADADLGVYQQRIEELARLLQKAKPDKGEIVEWLVRCAEHPATRFEGAYELARGVETLSAEEDVSDEDADEEDDESSTEAAAKDISEDDAADDSEDGDEEEGDGGSEFEKLASLLSRAQKDRLLEALYDTAELKDGDSQLIRLARLWKDARLQSFLIAQLRRVQYDPTQFSVTLASTLAELLDDDDITSLADEYQELVYDQLEAEQAEEESDSTDSEAGEKAGENEEEAEEVKVKFGSVEGKQQRSEALKKFLAAVERHTEPKTGQ